MTSRNLCALAISLAALGTFTHDARAQAQSVTLPPSPAIIHTTNTVTIAGTYSVDVGAVAQNALQGNPCNPGACFDALLTVHANRGWQLQVTLAPTPANFTVAWIEKPQNVARPLTAGIYQTIATGTTATPAQNLSVMYNANRTTGRGGGVPTAAQVAAVLVYRVVASP